MKSSLFIALSLLAASTLCAESKQKKASSIIPIEVSNRDDFPEASSYAIIEITPDWNDKIYTISKKDGYLWAKITSYSYENIANASDIGCQLNGEDILSISKSYSSVRSIPGSDKVLLTELVLVKLNQKGSAIIYCYYNLPDGKRTHTAVKFLVND